MVAWNAVSNTATCHSAHIVVRRGQGEGQVLITSAEHAAPALRMGGARCGRCCIGGNCRSCRLRKRAYLSEGGHPLVSYRQPHWSRPPYKTRHGPRSTPNSRAQVSCAAPGWELCPPAGLLPRRLQCKGGRRQYSPWYGCSTAPGTAAVQPLVRLQPALPKGKQAAQPQVRRQYSPQNTPGRTWRA